MEVAPAHSSLPVPSLAQGLTGGKAEQVLLEWK